MPIQETLESSSTFLRTLAAQAANFLPNLLVALLILAVGFFLAGRLAVFVTRALGASARIDETVRGPLVAITRYVVIIFTLLVALSQIGVQMTSLLAVLGAAGLAVGLALQGTLTNIAAGIMLLWLRPFRVGDYIETQNFAGTVHEIGLFTSHLETFDGLFVFAPNSTLWNVWMRNHSRAASRLLAWTITLPRTVPFEEARDLLVSAFPRDGGEDTLSEPIVFLDQLTADAQVLVLRGRVKEGAISNVQRRTAERVRQLFIERFGEAGEPRAIQRTLPTDADPSRYLGRDEAPEASRTLVNQRLEEPTVAAGGVPPVA
ncbi:mechanosensitive ion channel family protein [Aureimonas sp. AU12]|uniref:mechanosensitive ion channel family protein n=1 Tax=Aureimonas sp. AU12 TaxID=1638161 RepID=UPI0007066A89|nr:mechanosensitive ion channel family protein [Aureimonas sp. AU12]BAT29768.1 mechanosensitive ion channel protein [Aureimonas sp. AU12]